MTTGLHWTGPIAQRLEPPAHNRPVPGSNPGGPTFARACRASFGGQAHAKVSTEAAQQRRWTTPNSASFGWQAKRAYFQAKDVHRSCVAAKVDQLCDPSVGKPT